MDKQVVDAWNVENMEEMMAALQEAMDAAKDEGHHPATVYPNRRRVTLVRTTLADGSHVMDVCFFEGENSLLWPPSLNRFEAH